MFLVLVWYWTPLVLWRICDHTWGMFEEERILSTFWTDTFITRSLSLNFHQWLWLVTSSFHNGSIWCFDTGRGTAGSRGRWKEIMLTGVSWIIIKKRLCGPFCEFLCPMGSFCTVNCQSTFIVYLVWSNHVRIVGGQSGQSFCHLVELKLRVAAV